MASDMNLDDVRKRIEDRQQFLERVVGFVQPLAAKIGKQLEYAQHSSHTNAKYSLYSFENFSFHSSTSWGGKVKVDYHWPDVQYAGGTVLEVEWDAGDMKKCRVIQWLEPSDEWRRALEGVMRGGWEEAVARHQQKEHQHVTEQIQRQERIDAARRAEDELRSEAARLKISL